MKKAVKGNSKKAVTTKKVRARSSVEWYTPPYIIEALTKAAGRRFDLDVCSPREKHWTAKRCLTPKQDGLKAKWPTGKFIWCNPPYDYVLPWAKKMLEFALMRPEAGSGVMLVNISGSSEWWRLASFAASGMLILGHRLKFVDENLKPSKSSNPHTSVLIGFGPLGARAVAGAQLVDSRLEGTFFPAMKKQEIAETYFPDQMEIWERSGLISPDDAPEVDPDTVEGDPTDKWLQQLGKDIAKAEGKRKKAKAKDKAAAAKAKKKAR